MVVKGAGKIRRDLNPKEREGTCGQKDDDSREFNNSYPATCFVNLTHSLTSCLTTMYLHMITKIDASFKEF